MLRKSSLPTSHDANGIGFARLQTPRILRASLPHIFAEGPVSVLKPLHDLRFSDAGPEQAAEGQHDTTNTSTNDNTAIATATEQGGAALERSVVVGGSVSESIKGTIVPEATHVDEQGEELMIVEVRKLDKPVLSSPTGKHRIKQEPGTESATKTARRRVRKPKKTKQTKPNAGSNTENEQGLSPQTSISVFGGDANAGSGPFNPFLNTGVDSNSMVSDAGFTPLLPHDPYDAFAHIGDLTMPPATLPPGPPCDGVSSSGAPSSPPLSTPFSLAPPPAYQPKSMEQLFAETHAALEERILSRLSTDIAKTLGVVGSASALLNKRGRAVPSLDEAEANLKAASAEYAKAKAADERRANKRTRLGKKEDDDGATGGDGKTGKGEKGEKGEKSEKSGYVGW